MMREIKFRAWSLSEEKMYECVSIATSREKNRWITQVLLTNGLIDMLEGEYVLMQYTGLKDCEGKEIYEGDILEFNDNASARSGVFKNDKIIKGYVIFEEGMYQLHDYENSYDLYEVLINDEESKVIGNIYESGE